MISTPTTSTVRDAHFLPRLRAPSPPLPAQSGSRAARKGLPRGRPPSSRDRTERRCTSRQRRRAMGLPASSRFLGDLIGFVVESSNPSTRPIYITGDTVWFAGVAEVSRRFPAGLVLLFAGSARTRGPFELTMNTNDAIETAHAFA